MCLLKGTISFSGKMTYLHAIHAILLKDSKACQVVATKEFIDEIATIVGDIISKDNNSHQKDFEVIAKILVKLNLIDQGKDLIDSMKMSFGHTVWEASLGLKKISVIETVTVIKFMQKLIEICKN